MKLRQNEDGSRPPVSLGETLRAIPGDFLVCLMFFTRLPVPAGSDHSRPMSRACQMFPAVGLVIGLIGSGVIALGSVLHLPAPAISILAIAAMITATGALHEDGLADMVDGFGGGHERARKLDIMKDSYIGTYGVLALILSQSFRIILIASLLPMGLRVTIPVLVASQITSRTCSMLLWASLPSARSTGLSQSAGQPNRASLLVALGATILALACLWLAGMTGMAILIAVALCGVVTYALIGLCRRQIGGQTGDTIGATQQICDLAFMAGVLISVGIAKDFL